MTAEEEKAKVRRAWLYWLREIEDDMDEKPWEWYSLFVRQEKAISRNPVIL